MVAWPDPTRRCLDRVAARYGGLGRFAQGYVGGKLRLDPVHRALLALGEAEPFGQVVDIGCGRGQVGLALLEGGVAEAVLGVDGRAAHLAQARAAGAGLAFSTRLQDFAADRSIAPGNTILMIDVLYQIDDAAQLVLLETAAAAARNMLLIRTPDPALRLRSALIGGYERAARRLLPNGGAVVNPPAPERIAETLEGLGFTVERQPCRRGTPFANMLLIARRRRQPTLHGTG